MRTSVLAALVMFAASVNLAAEEPLEIEVRVTQGGGAKGALTRSDFVVRENGISRELLDVRYVPPVTQWEADPARAEPTWIYVLVEAGYSQSRGVLAGLGCALRGSFPEQIRISIGGMPFAAVSDSLRDELPALLRATTWTGHDWAQPLPAFADRSQFRLQWQLAKQFGIYRYRDLVERLAEYPGKKIIFVLRPDFGPTSDPEVVSTLSFDDAADNWKPLVTEAIRSRIAIHTSAVPRGPLPTAPAQPQLVELAQWTGGTVVPPVLKTGNPLIDLDIGRRHQLISNLPRANRKKKWHCQSHRYMQDVMAATIHSAGDYYVLRYKPAENDEASEVHMLDVAVPGHDVRLRGPRGYFAPDAKANLQRLNPGLVHLYNALESGTLDDAPISVRRAISPYHGGESLVVSTVSIAPTKLTNRTSSHGVAVDFEVLARATDLDSVRLPAYFAWRFARVFSKAEWERLASDPRAFLQRARPMQLTAGRYLFEYVWRDNFSGQIGVTRQTVEVPDLSSPSSTGDLFLSVDQLNGQTTPVARSLLTDRNTGAPPPTRFAMHSGTASVGVSPDHVYRIGETLRAVYVIRPSTRQEFREEKLTRVVVRRISADDVLQLQPDVTWISKLASLKVQLSIPTQSLAPGDYLVVVERAGDHPSFEQPITIVEW